MRILNSAPRVLADLGMNGLSVKAQMNGDQPELLIMDDIGENPWTGEGVSDVTVKSFLDDHKDSQVKVYFNSEGGNAFQGLSMHNLISAHGNVSGVITGLAFSAAAMASMGCKHLAMHKASSFGIHKSWTIAMGNVEDLQATIEWLENVDSHQVDMYMERTGASKKQVADWMTGTRDGTVMTAAQALDHGFCDEIIGREAPEDSDLQTSKKRFAASAGSRIYQQRQRAIARGFSGTISLTNEQT